MEAIRRRGGTESHGLEWIGADGATWSQTFPARRGLAPYYNTLDPRVQEAMLSAVRELVRRYAGHDSFRGLALRLSAYGYAQLPGPDWGMDDATIARFQHDTAVGESHLYRAGQHKEQLFAGMLRHRAIAGELRCGMNDEGL